VLAIKKWRCTILATGETLILGASYGSLLATKMLLAGHSVTLVGLPEEARLINRKGTRVRLPIRGRDEPVEIISKDLPGRVLATTPDAVDPAEFDLVALAMQEPQYRSSGVRDLIDAVATSKRPCMSIMNMPPLPYLARLPGLSNEIFEHCYTDTSVWANFDPDLMTLASPDPQAFRPSPDEPNLLQVSLPTNFKVARFVDDEHTAMLRQIQTDIEAVRYETDDGPVELPVKLKVHDSVFVPLAKWSMLLTGNYRCIGEDGPRSIRDAVHSDLEQSRSIYEWVSTLCRKIGAAEAEQVPFEKYARAAEVLGKPSSAARALFAGAPNIERVDCLVKNIAASVNMQSDIVDEIVTLVDAKLEANRRAA